MRTSPHIRGVDRILDANLNRAKEGLRVCEEVARFVLNDERLTRAFKGIRHRLTALAQGSHTLAKAITERQAGLDVGKRICHRREMTRTSLSDVFYANIQRVKESVRVLEEFGKLRDIKASAAFKKLRYDVYTLEKKVSERLLQ